MMSSVSSTLTSPARIFILVPAGGRDERDQRIRRDSGTPPNSAIAVIRAKRRGAVGGIALGEKPSHQAESNIKHCAGDGPQKRKGDDAFDVVSR
jgi:hypothetical protein